MGKNLNKSIDALVDTIPILNTLTSMENKVNENLKRMRKSLLQSCSVFDMCVDTELGIISVYARQIDAPKSDQTDESELQWTIERVECEGEEIKLNGWQTQAAIEIINKQNSSL